MNLADIIKPMVNRNFIAFYLIMLISSAVFMYVFLWYNDFFVKAQKYDFYKDIIESLENCTVKPTCFCPERMMTPTIINSTVIK